jgi:hypothetical protein
LFPLYPRAARNGAPVYRAAKAELAYRQAVVELMALVGQQ